MSLFPDRVETERLDFRAVGSDAADLDPLDYYRVCSRGEPGIERVTEYMTWSPHETPKETAEYLAHAAEQREQNEGITYIIRPKEDEDGAGDIAGSAGFQVDWDRRVATLGMWLRKPFWGRGYSGERAEAMCDVAFETLDLDVVAVTHDPENEPSKRAIEKYVDRLGGRREGVIRNDIVISGDPRDSVRYSISREEYAVRRPPKAAENRD
ncbi:GNAT family N-acetyltransferase [Halocalculus aciditolerans]|uniref:GNAT family acetyltransferase n=1 Tax=Halocalculus aciditolerans TaxID=1383812 RepID=A0A830F6P4_9EURY|nr:GNAT family protein [Halocalculus aciditolerans]GGL59865.1 GNAT family acetyltransferase [Halocalculus aciditolerans]